MNETENTERIAKWGKQLTLIAILSLLTGFYFLGYPAILFFIEKKNYVGEFGSLSYQIIELTASPLIWLNENISFYEVYIDWLEQKITQA